MATRATSPAAVQSDIDLWTDEALLSPYELWRRLRDAGPVVELPQYGVYALARYRDVREALTDWEVFSSAKGVTLNEQMNEVLAGGTLCSDPPLHRHLREVLRRPLGPKELRALEPEVQKEADELVDQLVAKGSFDAPTELSQHLPMNIVSKRVGLPEEGREHMLDWAFANFDCFGPMNHRTERSFPKLKEAVDYSFDPTLPGKLKPGGWAAQLFEAGAAGELEHPQCQAMLNDYWGPSLDTTIFATTGAVWLFAKHPDQWTLLRSNPKLIPHAVNEVVRFESPLPQFSRVTTRDHEVDGVSIPAGSRVLVMYGSANRDERKWENPDRFDITRKPSDHLGFGFGEHNCAGQAIARIEIRALITALVDRVERFEVGEPTYALNNMLRGIAALDVTVR